MLTVVEGTPKFHFKKSGGGSDLKKIGQHKRRFQPTKARDEEKKKKGERGLLELLRAQVKKGCGGKLQKKPANFSSSISNVWQARRDHRSRETHYQTNRPIKQRGKYGSTTKIHRR